MKQELEGIFLKKIHYNDSLQIAYILTAEYGTLPFLVRNKRKNNIFAYLIPMSIIKFQSNIRLNKDFQYLESVHSSDIIISIYENIHKLNIVQFFAEFLYIISPYPHSDKRLFNFLKNWVLQLEQHPNSYTSIWHIYGLFKLTMFFGIEPHNNFSEKNCFFDIVQAQYIHETNNNTLNKEISVLWYKFLSHDIDLLVSIPMNKEQKHKLLNSIINYYSIHSQININIKSLSVLKEFYSVYS